MIADEIWTKVLAIEPKKYFFRWLEGDELYEHEQTLSIEFVPSVVGFAMQMVDGDGNVEYTNDLEHPLTFLDVVRLCRVFSDGYVDRLLLVGETYEQVKVFEAIIGILHRRPSMVYLRPTAEELNLSYERITGALSYKPSKDNLDKFLARFSDDGGEAIKRACRQAVPVLILEERLPDDELRWLLELGLIENAARS